jgi:hypothetical protein
VEIGVGFFVGDHGGLFRIVAHKLQCASGSPKEFGKVKILEPHPLDCDLVELQCFQEMCSFH